MNDERRVKRTAFHVLRSTQCVAPDTLFSKQQVHKDESYSLEDSMYRTSDLENGPHFIAHGKRLCYFVTLLAILWLGLSGWQRGAVWAAPAEQSVRAEITSPHSGDTVRGLISIRGTAVHPDFWKYELSWAPTNRVGNAWNLIALQNNQVIDGQLAAWNTVLIPDGTYDLRLRVVRKDSNYEEVFVTSLVIANAGPPETLTPEGTLTPLPTLTPQATLIIPTTPSVQIFHSTPVPTPSPAPVLVPTKPSGPKVPVAVPGLGLDITKIWGSFLYGAGITLGVFLLIGILQLLRRILPWILRSR